MSSFFSRLKKGLTRSRESLAQMMPGRDVATLSENDWQDIEDGLIMADCGGELSTALVGSVRKRRGASIEALKSAMLDMLPTIEPVNHSVDGPFVLLVVGVNGTGKTTTIGKLATMYRREGKSVLVGAGDTFRAAAVEQLAVWVERAGADMVRQHAGADP
ncbi:MAG: AAA family ATPase, partial [Mariprofundus sp.]